MSEHSFDSGPEIQKLLLFCVPFSDKKTLLEIRDSLHKQFGVTGGDIIPISAGYTFNGIYLPNEAQFRLEFLVPFDKNNDEIISFIQDAIKKAGWEVPFIQSTNATLNPDALSYVQSGHAEASRLRRVQSRLKAGLTALSLVLASVAGALVHQHSVNEQNRAVLKRVRDLQTTVEEKILAIEAKLAEGGNLDRREPEMFGAPSFADTQEVLRAVRETENQVQKSLGKK